MYNQLEELETKIQKIEEHSVAAKQVLQELRQPVKLTTQTIQQMTVEADIKIKEVFRKLSVISREKKAEQVTTEMNLLMKGWK